MHVNDDNGLEGPVARRRRLAQPLKRQAAPKAQVALSSWRAAGIAPAFCWAIEFGQLSSIPALLARRSMLARLVLGTTFNVPALFWYAIGIAPVAGADRMLRARGSGQS